MPLAARLEVSCAAVVFPPPALTGTAWPMSAMEEDPGPALFVTVADLAEFLHKFAPIDLSRTTWAVATGEPILVLLVDDLR